MCDYLFILHRCRKKDPKAQLQFYRLFYKGVYNSSLRILSHPAEAEEIMQECMLKVLTQTEFLLEDPAKMENWLKRIAINKSIDVYRRKRKLCFVEIDEKRDFADESVLSEEEEPIFQTEILHRFLGQLPEGCRLVFTLRVIEEWNYPDIAAQLQLSESTVRSQFTRAKQKLIRMIKEQQYENIFR